MWYLVKIWCKGHRTLGLKTWTVFKDFSETKWTRTSDEDCGYMAMKGDSVCGRLLWKWTFCVLWTIEEQMQSLQQALWSFLEQAQALKLLWLMQRLVHHNTGQKCISKAWSVLQNQSPKPALQKSRVNIYTYEHFGSDLCYNSLSATVNSKCRLAFISSPHSTEIT